MVDVYEGESDVLFRGLRALHRPGPRTAPHITDENGVATITGIDPDAPILVAATAPGFASPRIEDSVQVVSGAPEALIELMPLSGAKFPLANPSASPAEGTDLAVLPDPLAPRTTPLPTKAHVAAGFVVAEGCPPDFLSALVQTRDGRVGRIARGTPSRPADPVVFRAPRFLDVDTFSPEGLPAHGVRVEVCSHPIYGFGAAAVTGETEACGSARSGAETPRSTSMTGVEARGIARRQRWTTATSESAST